MKIFSRTKEKKASQNQAERKASQDFWFDLVQSQLDMDMTFMPSYHIGSRNDE